ncbi:hypothetical protein Tco_1025671, partial [Tanacetum coccineum]
LLMEAKEKGDVLDAEAEAFLADVECTAPYSDAIILFNKSSDIFSIIRLTTSVIHISD